MLSIVYGLQKFHYYAYGRHVTVETDHKPLEAIFKKHLFSAPPRIARMMLCIQKYDVEIKYVLGKEIPLADALSWLNPCDTHIIKGLELHMHLISRPKLPRILFVIRLNPLSARDGQIRDLIVHHIFTDTGIIATSSRLLTD